MSEQSVDSDAILGKHDALLSEYRRQVLEETKYVYLIGIPLPRRRDGRHISLRIPLDEVYIRLQGLPEEHLLAEEEVKRHDLDQQSFNTTMRSQRSVFRTLGEYLYRWEETDRPEQHLELMNEEFVDVEDHSEQIDLDAALQKHSRLAILGAPGAGKSTLLRYLARRAAKNVAGPVPVLVSLRDYAVMLEPVMHFAP